MVNYEYQQFTILNYQLLIYNIEYSFSLSTARGKTLFIQVK